MQAEIKGSIDWVGHVPVMLAVLGVASTIAAILIKYMTREMFLTRDELREKFAVREDTVATANKVNALEHLFARNSERMDDVHDRTTRLEESDKHQVQRLAESLERVGVQMDAIANRVDEMTKAQSQTTNMLTALQTRVDLHERTQSKGR
jgi:uncharacterized protein YoxC